MTRPLLWLSSKTGIPRGELRWAAVFSAAVMAFTCLPYVFGVIVTPPGHHYSGLLSNVHDSNVYLAWMRQAMLGHWLFRNPFTTESQAGPGFFNVFFLALGLAARILHLEPIWLYHASRLLFGFLLLVTAYVFAARFCRSLLARRLAVALLALSSGFGWLYGLIRPGAVEHPIDLGANVVIPEAITFLSLLLYPLFLVSVWLMLAAYLLLMRAWETGSRRALIAAALAVMLLANIHTYDVLAAYCVLVGYLFAKGCLERRVPWREAAMTALLIAVSLGPAVYQYALFRLDPVFQAKALTPTLTPSARWVALGFGLPLLLAISAAVMDLKQRRMLFLSVWLAANWLVIAYAPVSFQRKMIEGMHIPICVLAAALLGDWLLPRARRAAGAVAVGVVLVTIPSNAFCLWGMIYDLRTNNARYVHMLMPPVYLTDDEVSAMRWLGENSRCDEAVLSSNMMGAYIPPVAGNRVFVGHWAETIHYRQKVGQIFGFFDPRVSDESRLALIRSAHLRYVFYGQYERWFGTLDPNTLAFATPVYRRGQVTVYRIDAPAG